jgi:hypothetical protein
MMHGDGVQPGPEWLLMVETKTLAPPYKPLALALVRWRMAKNFDPAARLGGTGMDLHLADCQERLQLWRGRLTSQGSTPEYMENVITPTIKVSERIVNAICVDVVDLGTVKTPWGNKPQVKLVFESDEPDQYGEQRILVRTFHKHTHSMSALSIAVKSWCNRNLDDEEAIGALDLASLVGEQARLKLEPTPTKNGGSFDKIIEFLPPGEVHVQHVKYQRDED